MENVTIITPSGASLVMSYHTEGAILAGIKGLHDCDISPISARGYLQHGSTFDRSLLGERALTIEYYLHTENLYDYYRQRDRLNAIFNPVQGDCRVIYENDFLQREIQAHVTSMPDEQEHHGTLRLYRVEMTASNPLWHDQQESRARLNEVYGGLTFPLRFKAPGVRFATSGAIARPVIIGNVPSPVRIEIDGGVVNPKITLTNTGEYISVPITVPYGTRMTITTGYAQKAVKLTSASGIVTDAYHLIAPTSRFFELQPGQNQITYEHDDAGSADVTVNWRNWYTGA